MISFLPLLLSQGAAHYPIKYQEPFLGDICHPTKPSGTNEMGNELQKMSFSKGNG